MLVVLHRLGFATGPLHLLGTEIGFLLLPNRWITGEAAPSTEALPQLTAWLQSQDASGDASDLYPVDEWLDDRLPMLEQISIQLEDREAAVFVIHGPDCSTSPFSTAAISLRTDRSSERRSRSPGG